MKNGLDAVDQKIIELLQENARISIKDIAAQVFLSSPAVTSRIERLEKNGIINGMFVGLIYIAIIYLLSSIVTGNFLLNITSIIMIITSVLTGALGGIIGVNKK